MPQSSPSRLPNLDLLRLLSALLVVFFHYGFRMRLTGEGGGTGFPELAPVAQWFEAGLLIFFAISGYVIAMSAENRSAWDFAAGRFARLWPAFVLCATVTALILVVWPVPGIPAPTLKQWLAHAVILSRILGQPFLDGAYWTIAYEIIFYGWVFALMAAGLWERAWRPAVLVWLLLSIANEWLIGSNAFRKLLITEYSGFFAFGLVLFHLHRRFTPGTLALLYLAVFWGCAAPFVVEHQIVAMYGVHRNPFGVALTGPLALAAVALCASARRAPVPAGLALALGSLTYPLYLLHQHVGYAVFARFGGEANRWVVLAALLAALLAASFVVARWVEPACRRWILSRLRNLVAKLPPGRMPAGAAA